MMEQSGGIGEGEQTILLFCRVSSLVLGMKFYIHLNLGIDIQIKSNQHNFRVTVLYFCLFSASEEPVKGMLAVN